MSSDFSASNLEASARLRAAWHRGEPTFGGWSIIGDTYAAELLSRAGFDWVGVDMQHGMISAGQVPAMLQALAITRTPAFVRVGWNRPEAIMRALDEGANGVIVPMVNSADDARAAVAACRYPPAGIRSWGPARAALGGAYDADRADAAVICVVMVETKEAVEQVDAIVAVAGVDAVFVGMRDLALSQGDRSPTPSRQGALEQQVLAVRDACKRAGVVAGIFSGSVESAIHWTSHGFQFIAVVSDSTLLAQSAADAAARVKAAAANPADAAAY